MIECEVHKVHHPSVAVVHEVYAFPEHLQRRLYGEIRDGEQIRICGTGKDSLEICIAYMLREGPPPAAKIGRDTFNLAQRAVTLYENALAEQRIG